MPVFNLMFYLKKTSNMASEGKKFSWKGIASFGLIALAAAAGVIIANNVITPTYQKIKSKVTAPKIVASSTTKKEEV